MEDQENVESKNLSITIIVKNDSLRYNSDFDEAGTVFWLEAVKDLIIGKKFSDIQLKLDN